MDYEIDDDTIVIPDPLPAHPPLPFVLPATQPPQALNPNPLPPRSEMVEDDEVDDRTSDPPKLEGKSFF